MNGRAKKALLVLRKRQEFLAIAQSGKKWVAPGLILQMAAVRQHETSSPVRYGLTASSKIGPAVLRNRARRRLRALVMEILPFHVLGGCDCVLIARAGTTGRDFAALRQDLVTGLKKLEAWRE